MIDYKIVDNTTYHKSEKPRIIYYSREYYLFNRKYGIRLFRRIYTAENIFEDENGIGFGNKQTK